MHTGEKRLLMLRPSEIMIVPERRGRSFDEYDLKLLADSISSIGIIHPLTVMRSGKGPYELISGERRLRAARLAGLRRIPCILHKTDAASAAIYAVTENLQCRSLHFFEEAEALEKLTTLYGIPQSEISARLGIPQAALCNRLRLLRLDGRMRERIIKAELSEKQTLLLLRIPEERRDGALDKIISQSLTYRQSEQLINEILCPVYTYPLPEEPDEEPKDEPVRKAVIGDMRLFDNSLEKLLDTLRATGIEAGTQRRETDSFIEYRVRIKKDAAAAAAATFKQLKIC